VKHEAVLVIEAAVMPLTPKLANANRSMSVVERIADSSQTSR
jgi:hypothetical protein